MSSHKLEIWQPLILAAVMAVGMLIGLKISDRDDPLQLIDKVNSEEMVSPGRVEEIIRFIDAKYAFDVDADELISQAIKYIFTQLDPHSHYIPKDQLKEVSEQMNGSYNGLGIETLFYRDSLLITNVYPQSPAAEAGIAIHDIIVSVDDTLTSGVGLDYNQIKKYLSHNKKDSIQLEVIKWETKQIETVFVHPGKVPLASADIAFMLNDSVGYIAIKRFQSKVYREFMESLEMLTKNKDFKHLVIDVRGNPGGYLPETVKILSQLFKEKGRLLVYTESKSNRIDEYKTTGKPFFEIDNIVCLINEESASGSEILAGALQDWDRGLVIGRRTFGKGLVQEQYMLKNGGALRLTVAKYFTPTGRSIQRSFDERKAYRMDLKNRKENGELQDLSKTEIEDSTKYFTKVLKREVFGGGGIYPDIFISLDSLYFNDNYPEIRRALPAFMYLFRSNNQTYFPADYAEYLSNPCSEQLLIEDFVSYLKNDNIDFKELDIYKHREEWYQLLQFYLIKIIYGEVPAKEHLSKSDPFINSAIEALVNFDDAFIENSGS